MPSYDIAMRNGNVQDMKYLDCLANHSEMLLLSAALLQRGMKEETVCKIVGGNFFNYFMNALP